jgi:PAS domain S-box-containing protein
MENAKISLVERQLLVAFAVVIAVLAIVGGVAWNGAEKSVAGLRMVDHTREVMSQLDDFNAKVDRAEDRQWAYFLTRDKSYLLQRDTALEQLQATFLVLKKITVDNPTQQARLGQLEAGVQKRMEILIDSQTVFDAQDFAAARPLFDAGQSAAVALRVISDDIKNNEETLLERRKYNEQSRLDMISLSIVLLLMVLAALAIWVRRSIMRRLAAERELIELRKPFIKNTALQDAIFNSANFSSIATDAKGVIQIFNVGAERMLGYSAAAVMNQITPADISDPQELIARAAELSSELGTSITPGFEALVFKAMRGIEDIYELTYIRKDGTRFPALVSVTALRDAQGKIIGYLLIGTDNTARKQAEEALIKANALQNAIFNSANFSSIATDAKGVIQIFNVGAERMLGYSAAEVVDTITPADISDPQEVVSRAEALSLEIGTPIAPGFEALVFKASRGIEDIYELNYIRKNGSHLPAIVSVTALRDPQDRIIGFLLIGTDNTARKLVESERELMTQRLRDQQFYTRSLIESNIDAIMTTDPLGIISDVNQEAQSLTGRSRNELIGTPFKNYFTDPERAEESINLALRDGKLTNYELIAKGKDGKEVTVSYNATTFNDSNNRLLGVFASARDITERKSVEKLMEQNNIELKNATALADKANMAKSEFLSSMSHELRTPLNAVLGFAQLMASDIPAPSEAQKGSIDQILQAGWYLLRLINEILDLAMIESGKVTLSQEPMSFTEVLQDCEAMITPQAQAGGIQMIFPNLSTLFYVYADRIRVKQAMVNLLSNAIKYNREGGSVTVNCVMCGDNRVRVSVIDTGAGLNTKQLAQLFQPFNRLGQEAGTKEGTGIGLVVTRQLVELMGGTIGVESKVGVGSVFWIELAASSAPELIMDEHHESELAQTPRLPESDETQKRTLLYVEDNPANLALVTQLVARRSDLKMLSAIDGHLGIQMARAYQPDVILMDINLPGISGFGALKVLQKDIATAQIPVIALSANAMPRDIEKGLEAGFFRYLTKPIQVVEFMDALDTALHHANEQGWVQHHDTVQ